MNLNRGNVRLLDQYLQLSEGSQLELPKFRTGDVPVASLWNFLQTYEHPAILQRQLPVEALVMFPTVLRQHTSEECWERYLLATSVFVQRMVKRKYQKKKTVWAEFLRTVYYLLVRLYKCSGAMECSVDGHLETFTTIVMESLATCNVLFTTSYKIPMAEELLSYWSSCPALENAMECGWLPFIDVTVLLTTWSYLAHYPSDLKQSKLRNCLTPSTDPDQIDMPMLSTSAPGPVTTAVADPFRTSMSRDEQDQVDRGDSIARSISSTSSSISCVTPASCVYLRSEGLPSTSHLVQVCLCSAYCDISNCNFMQMKIWEATQDPTTTGIRYGRLLTKLSASIGSTRSLAQFQLLLQAMTSLTANELPLAFGGAHKTEQ